MVEYGYKNQRETLQTYEDLYFGSCLVWKKNELFFKGTINLATYMYMYITYYVHVVFK